MNLFNNLKNSVTALGRDNVPTLSAALAYYSVFAIGPLLLILISLLGFIFGRNAVEGEIIGQLSGLLGKEAAATIQTIIAGAQKQSTGTISLVIGFVLLILSAGGVFRQLKQSLNQIWNLEPAPDRGVMALVRERFLSFSMVVVVAFLLAVSLILSALVSVLATYFQGVLPLPTAVFVAINIFISFWVIMVLFAVMYKVLPDIKIPWSLVWGGATLSSILFTLGRSLIAWYIGHSSATSSYGAAGTLVVILLWVYYTGLIFMLGAEYVKAAAQARNLSLAPEPYAYKTKEVRVAEAKNEFSPIENYLIYEFSHWFADQTTPILKSVFGSKKKSFWNRVQERL